ncbi:TIR domain-containing protein [Glaciihabitans arcticus]|uniref:TIR domain-containing protein n=1 Tax=Glaciihabitans arcticus TaxID=2668039 RepID=A0A4Q9GSA7_9MICO|nr:TIR domain-containing protein [Glaciihabitans arcticus]
MAPRAFISFEMEDQWARNFLSQQAKDKNNLIEFVDYSVKNPWDTSWKTECKIRISRTRGTIVLIGETTWQSDAVLWEIAESNRQGHFIFGIQVSSTATYRVPAGLPSTSVIRWDFDQIVQWLGTWT